MTENDQKEYTGWREPKIAMSFHRNRLWYYGIVWVFILLFLALNKNDSFVLNLSFFGETTLLAISQ